jgi:DNA-binding response OmpR family regulator
MTVPLILLVDPDVSAVVPLERAGYHVRHVVTAQQADALYAESALVLTELDLPDQDGVVLVSEIREWSNVPIFVCSGRDSSTDRTLALKLGADMAVAKPIPPDELVARVRAILRRGRKGNPAGSRVLEHLWGQEWSARLQHILGVHIHRLRAALSHVGVDKMIQAQWRTGYRLFDMDDAEKEAFN